MTSPAAISRRQVTISLLSVSTRGRAPSRSCLARFAATKTSSKRFGIFLMQSSTVTRAMTPPLPRGRAILNPAISLPCRAQNARAPCRLFHLLEVGIDDVVLGGGVAWGRLGALVLGGWGGFGPLAGRARVPGLGQLVR